MEDYLQGLTANVTAAIAQPQKVQKTGYYSLRYTVEYQATPGQYAISLGNLRHKMAQ